MIHTVKDVSVVNEAEVDVFLELSCFFYDPMDISNSISGSSAFSKSSLYVWKLLAHVLLKPHVDFEHNLTGGTQSPFLLRRWVHLGHILGSTRKGHHMALVVLCLIT